ncbi:uncharacterized protein LOC111400486 [Olea europaea var. sylvestris]|uniref:uncharacterized protein LOC111400486 n=1 Tax=Olea europaea var. sylvestris TaxID=158386 RepID=UPI000C1D1711|nr:uncharacterized protein LOC111400486 [Olea europaea var. sylvestris]
MDLSSVSKLVLLPRAIHKCLVSTTMISLVLLLMLPLFLNGTLIEHVYIEQPPGYIDLRFPNHVCQLKKALYGLKQAPRACTLIIIYLLLYVDDIIITGYNSSLIDKFPCKLNFEFATKDLGHLSYFLGLEASTIKDGLFISQLKYARDILTRAQLLDNKLVHIPMVVSQHLPAEGHLFSNPTLYRSLVSALQYLTSTRPDIAHTINSVSQFLYATTIDHFLSVKRILRYIKGTLHFGLTFHTSTTPGALIAYSDTNWQPTVSRSNCESKYRALAHAAFKLLWITQLLQDLQMSLP